MMMMGVRFSLRVSRAAQTVSASNAGSTASGELERVLGARCSRLALAGAAERQVGDAHPFCVRFVSAASC
jgi:hypothetical protein